MSNATSKKDTTESPEIAKYIEISFKSIVDQISVRIQNIDERISNFEYRLERLINPSKSDTDIIKPENIIAEIEDNNQVIQRKKQIKDKELLDALSFLKEGDN